MKINIRKWPLTKHLQSFISGIFSLDYAINIFISLLIDFGIGFVSLAIFSAFPKLTTTLTIPLILLVSTIVFNYIFSLQILHKKEAVFSVSFFSSLITAPLFWLLPFCIFTYIKIGLITKSLRLSIGGLLEFMVIILQIMVVIFLMQLVLWVENSKTSDRLRFIIWNETSHSEYSQYDNTILFEQPHVTLKLISGNTMVFLVLLHFQRNNIDTKTYTNDNHFFHQLTTEQFNFIKYKMKKFRLWKRLSNIGGILSLLLLVAQDYVKIAKLLPVLDNNIARIIMIFLVIVMAILFIFTHRINYVFHQLKEVENERTDIK